MSKKDNKKEKKYSSKQKCTIRMLNSKARNATLTDCTEIAVCEIRKNGILAAACKRHSNQGVFVRKL